MLFVFVGSVWPCNRSTQITFHQHGYPFQLIIVILNRSVIWRPCIYGICKATIKRCHLSEPVQCIQHYSALQVNEDPREAAATGKRRCRLEFQLWVHDTAEQVTLLLSPKRCGCESNIAQVANAFIVGTAGCARRNVTLWLIERYFMAHQH